MKENEMSEFSWSGFFVVTACCSVLFNGAIKFLDGSYSSLLLIIGIVAMFLSAASWIGRILAQQSSKKRRNRRFAS